jgi:LPS sulfotransferase NodH
VTFLLEQAGPHEHELRAFCDPFEIPQDTAPYDKPACIMLFTNRSGSSLISEHMRASPYFGGFGEPLNHQFVKEQSVRRSTTSFLEYLQNVQRQHTANGELFGMKASVDQALMLMRSRVIPDYYNDVRWVLIERRDIVAQAISMYFAGQSKQWRSDQEGKAAIEPEYDFERLRLQVQMLSQRYVAMKSFCAVFGIEPYRITYEDFAVDPLAGAQALAAHLGVSNAAIDSSKVSTRQQRGDRNADFIQRFLTDYRASILG